MIPRKPKKMAQDPRYWRSVGNRRVRKARRRRRWSRLGILLGLKLALISTLGYAALRGWENVKRSSHFTLRSVHVEGVERGSSDAIHRRVAPLVGRNLFQIDLAEVSRAVAGDRWVRRASVRRVLPDRLHVAVEERRPAAAAVIREVAHLVDAHGVVIGPCGPDLVEDLPVLVGLGDDDETIATRLRDGVRMLERLRENVPSWHAAVSEMNLSRSDRVAVRLQRGDTVFYLDPGRVERNVAPYLTLATQIDARAGGAEYVDLRWKDRISVMPRASTWPN